MTNRTPHAFRFAPLLTAAAIGCSVGCSLSLHEVTECSSNADCRTAFGLGSTCGTDGFCEAPDIPERCGKSFPEDLLSDPEKYEADIVLGSLFSFETHLDTLQAAELAVRQVNQNGGLDGRRYAILHCDYEPMAGDDLDDIAAVELLAPYLADAVGVAAIIGPRGSSRTEATFNAIRGLDTIVISPSATSPALTALDGATATDDKPGFLWRTAPPDSLQSQVIAAEMRDREVTKAAVIFQQGAYGDALANLFVTRFTADGGESAMQFPFEAGSDFSSTVAIVADEIGKGNVEEVLFISSDIEDYVTFFVSATATPDLVEQYTVNLGSTTTGDGGLFLVDAAFSTMLLDATAGSASSLFPKVRGSRPAPAEGVLFNSFSAAYTSTFNEDSTGSAFTPHSYDAAWLVIYGTAWANFQESEIGGLGVARGLRKVSSGAPIDILPASWNTVVDRFRTGASIDVEGASGILDFDPTTEETSAPIETWRIVADPAETSGYGFERIDIVEP
ncbi:MAG: ABC transporter substrate-binding protein [Nannocystaceae bacterium]|nr:ABC transporter substrate-binding protein [Nannocystaceae bacterium]